jgi:hypothetical protein
MSILNFAEFGSLVKGSCKISSVFSFTKLMRFCLNSSFSFSKFIVWAIFSVVFKNSFNVNGLNKNPSAPSSIARERYELSL